MIGKQFGHYTILSQLGRGGMATVYKAEQRGLGRNVALKVLHQSLAADEVIVQRFQQEARIAASLHHAHVVTIYDVGEIDEQNYIAMRYIEGENLGQLLRREGALEPNRALAMLEQVAEALDFAHANSILHRDIKPANVMVEPGDMLTLTDFGIARAGESSHLTATRMVIGTPEYMSPEQARGEPVDKRSDLYALGVLMYEALGGRPPFSAASTPSLLYLHVHEAPPPLSKYRPDLPPALNDVVMKALAKDPTERFQSGREMMAAARAGLAQGLVAPPPSPAADATAATTMFDLEPGSDGRTAAMTPPPVVPRGGAPTPTSSSGGGTPAVPRAPAQTPPGVAAARREPAARAAGASTLTPPPMRPPVNDAMQATVFGQIEAAPPPPVAPLARKRGIGWIGPVAVGLALLLVAALVLTQTELLGLRTDPTPTAVAVVGPTTAPQVTTGPAVGPTTAPKPEEKPTVAPKPEEKPTAATATNTPVPATNTPVPATATPDPRNLIAAAQVAVAAGEFPKAVDQLRALRESPAVKADAPLAAQVDETLRKTHVVYGNQLLDQNKLDDAWGQYGEALKLLATDAEALDGQKRVVLTKNYQRMEAAWGKNDDDAIAALEENMQIDAGFRDTRQKLYALLIGKADALLDAGNRDGAFPVLMRALEVLPDATEARQRLARYTPTPTPAPAPKPQAPAPQQKPQQQPQYTPPQQQPQQQPQERPFQPVGAPV